MHREERVGEVPGADDLTVAVLGSECVAGLAGAVPARRGRHLLGERRAFRPDAGVQEADHGPGAGASARLPRGGLLRAGRLGAGCRCRSRGCSGSACCRASRRLRRGVTKGRLAGSDHLGLCDRTDPLVRLQGLDLSGSQRGGEPVEGRRVDLVDRNAGCFGHGRPLGTQVLPVRLRRLRLRFQLLARCRAGPGQPRDLARVRRHRILGELHNVRSAAGGRLLLLYLGLTGLARSEPAGAPGQVDPISFGSQSRADTAACGGVRLGGCRRCRTPSGDRAAGQDEGQQGYRQPPSQGSCARSHETPSSSSLMGAIP